MSTINIGNGSTAVPGYGGFPFYVPLRLLTLLGGSYPGNPLAMDTREEHEKNLQLSMRIIYKVFKSHPTLETNSTASQG